MSSDLERNVTAERARMKAKAKKMAEFQRPPETEPAADAQKHLDAEKKKLKAKTAVREALKKR
tara:strand:- start:537 stop:725 length:189 start_codon:yes stop_codon:yes gene_type:complete